MSRRSSVRRVMDPVRAFLETEAAGGVILLIAAAIALILANSPWADSYTHLWEREIGVEPYRLSLHGWIADGLMTVFFFVVGLEIKRELVVGELASARTAALPAVAAVGGMVGPAAIYLALTAGSKAADGWGIPLATDIAFAVGVLALFGDRVPHGLKIFLLALAIVDDIGGIVVIAAFYTESLSFGWVGLAVGALMMVPVAKRIGARHALLYLPLGIIAWAALFRSGLHPTIAGVAMGLLAPARQFHGKDVIDDLQRRLHPLSSFAIVPLFALATVGVALDRAALRSALDSRVFYGIVLGLFLGKLVGISGATAIAISLRIGRLPSGVRAMHVVGVAALAGMGFTLSLFLARLSFGGTEDLDIAKVGIMAGSLASAISGVLILRRATR